jgi:hypothetical protein
MMRYFLFWLQIDQSFDLLKGLHIRQSLDLGWFDSADPAPLALENVFEEELQAVSVYLYRGPAVGFDQRVEVAFQLLLRQGVGWTVVEFTDALHCPRIGIDGCLGFALTAQCAKMFTAQ